MIRQGFMKKTILIVLILIFSSRAFKAQDIHFSQIYETPVALNPANTGFFNGYIRAIANYREQWASMGNAFKTLAISVDGGVYKSKRRKSFIGIGATVFSDRAGAANLSNTIGLINVAGILKTSKKSALSLGISGGFNSITANYNKLTFASQFDGNQIDPQQATLESVAYRNFTTTDIGVGMAYEYQSIKIDQDHDDKKMYRFGIAAHHLNRPAQEFGPGSTYRLPVRFVGMFTSHIDFEDTKFTITPAFVLQRQGKAFQYFTGTYVKYRVKMGTKVTGQKTENAIGFGLFYRSEDGLVPKISYDIGDFAVALSYDVNLSGYKAASRYMGGFEVALRYNILASSLFEARSEFRSSTSTTAE
jgi:type IX secretion system PorP/SprF family membrane protein